MSVCPGTTLHAGTRPFVKPRSFDGGLAIASKRQLAGMRASATWRARCPGAPKAPPSGREALDAVSATWYLGCLGTRAAETTDDRGRFDDESR